MMSRRSSARITISASRNAVLPVDGDDGDRPVEPIEDGERIVAAVAGSVGATTRGPARGAAMPAATRVGVLRIGAARG